MTIYSLTLSLITTTHATSSLNSNRTPTLFELSDMTQNWWIQMQFFLIKTDIKIP